MVMNNEIIISTPIFALLNEYIIYRILKKKEKDQLKVFIN